MTRTRTVNPAEHVQEGDTLVLQGTYSGGLWTSPSGDILPAALIRQARTYGSVTRTLPSIEFEPGDVLVARPNPASDREFTYVRGQARFVGESTPGPSDASMRDLFDAGRARLIARKGHATAVEITRSNAHLLGPIPF